MWLEVRVRAQRLDAEAVVAMLEPYVHGAVVVEEPIVYSPADDSYNVDVQSPVTVKAYLDQDVADRWPALRRRLHRLWLASSLHTNSRWLEEDDWAHAWKEFFPVLHIGERLVVRPSWLDYMPQDREVVIHLDPGLAFGTGQHPTTRLCLEALEQLAWPDIRVLDLGSGSGILAIAAAKLGAAQVLALDIDPQAIGAARENALLNEVAEVVQVEVGSLGDGWPSVPARQHFDLAFVNIGALAICDLARELAPTLSERGRAVVSGFVETTSADVARCLEGAGLIEEQTLAEGAWRAIVARKA